MEQIRTERPIPIMEIHAGSEKIMSKTALYEMRDSGKIKFYYNGRKPYVYMSEINAALVPKDVHK